MDFSTTNTVSWVRLQRGTDSGGERKRGSKVTNKGGGKKRKKKRQRERKRRKKDRKKDRWDESLRSNV